MTIEHEKFQLKESKTITLFWIYAIAIFNCRCKRFNRCSFHCLHFKKQKNRKISTNKVQCHNKFLTPLFSRSLCDFIYLVGADENTHTR